MLNWTTATVIGVALVQIEGNSDIPGRVVSSIVNQTSAPPFADRRGSPSASARISIISGIRWIHEGKLFMEDLLASHYASGRSDGVDTIPSYQKWPFSGNPGFPNSL